MSSRPKQKKGRGEDSKQYPAISIIICTYNRYDTLGAAIASIEQQSLDADRLELIIVDNSTDIAAQKEFAANLHIKCKANYIIEGTPGLSRARNIGVAKASGKIVAFMDDDAIADPAWAGEVLRTFAHSLDVGIAGGPVRPIWPDARPTWLHPWLEGFLTIVDRGTEFRDLGEHEWVAGTNIAFRREPLIAAGGFNESIGRIGKLLLSNEELVLSTKLKAAGFRAFYNPAQIVQHRVHADRLSQTWLRQRVAWQAISDIFANPNGSVDFSADVKFIQDFLAKMPARQRGVHGLFIDLEDAELFQMQTAAVGALTRLLTQSAGDWRRLLNQDS